MTEIKVNNPDKIVKAEERIKTNPWDTEAWNVLLRDAQSKPIEDSRPVFERLVHQFPLAGQYVKSYISQEKKARAFENVEKLFKEFLPRIYHIDLWKFYLSYIKEKDNKTSSFKERMAQAYDYALERMGLDLKSFQIWSDYINFLKSTQVKSQYAESQKTIATRRIYHRAIVTPMIGIETIWRDYNAFETSINSLIAKKFIEERSRDYMNARRVAKEYEAITKGLNRNIPSVPPQNTMEEIKQVELWKKYIQWEKDNPLKTEDLITVTKRTLFAYEQCLLCLGHHPDIWYEAATYLEHASKLLAEKGDQENAKKFADKVAEMYQRATTILKENLLLHFAYADYEESRSKFDKVEAIYKNLIFYLHIDPTLVYIQYSRFIRRSRGIVAAREVFKQAREDHRTSYQVYINAAMMEHYCTKDPKVAQKILELGLKKYMKVPEFVLAYVDYMNHLNEDNNTRVLFERALGSGYMPPEKSRIIWDKFLQFESHVGDLASILKVERRRLQALEGLKEFHSHETALLIDRYKFMELFPCSDSELRSIGYRDISRQVSSLGGGGGTGTGSQLGGPGGQDPMLASGQDSGGGLSGSGSANAGNPGGGTNESPSYPRPDYNQMLPFKPKAYPRTGSHPVAGGEFPPPPAASALLRLLPPPECFHGPFVQVAKFIDHFLELKIPDEYAHPPVDENMIIDAGTALSIENAANSQLMRKRRRGTTHSGSGGTCGGGGGGISGGDSNNNSNNNGRDSDDEIDNKRSTMIGGIPTIPSAGGYILDVVKYRQQKSQHLKLNEASLM